MCGIESSLASYSILDGPAALLLKIKFSLAVLAAPAMLVQVSLSLETEFYEVGRDATASPSMHVDVSVVAVNAHWKVTV